MSIRWNITGKMFQLLQENNDKLSREDFDNFENIISNQLKKVRKERRRVKLKYSLNRR
jgi:hypothetical protein